MQIERIWMSRHHITHCGNNRQDVFFRDDDGSYYLEIFNASAAKFALEIFGYCLGSVITILLQ